MELDRIQQAVSELRVEAISRGFEGSYRITSGSMRPFLDTGDEILVAAAQPAGIHAGDIIVWRSPYRSLPLVAHRVIFRKRSNGNYLFRTKGDASLQWDRSWVAASEIVGKVIAVKRRGASRRIDHLPARIAGCARALAMYAWLLIAGGAAWIKRSVATLLPEQPFSLDAADLFMCGSTGVPSSDWRASVLAVADYMDEIGSLAGKRIGDATGGGGYSEEASALLRKGITVDLIPLEGGREEGTAGFDIILASRLINHFSVRHRRQLFLGSLAQYLRPGGILIINWVNAPAPDVLRWGARSFWRLVLGRRYQGPCPADFGAEGSCMGTALETDDAAFGTATFGMSPVGRDIDGRSRLLVLKKEGL